MKYFCSPNLFTAIEEYHIHILCLTLFYIISTVAFRRCNHKTQPRALVARTYKKARLCTCTEQDVRIPVPVPVRVAAVAVAVLAWTCSVRTWTRTWAGLWALPRLPVPWLPPAVGRICMWARRPSTCNPAWTAPRIWRRRVVAGLWTTVAICTCTLSAVALDIHTAQNQTKFYN